MPRPRPSCCEMERPEEGPEACGIARECDGLGVELIRDEGLEDDETLGEGDDDDDALSDALVEVEGTGAM